MENLQIPNIQSDKKHKEHRRSLSLEDFSIVNQRISFFTNMQTLYTRSDSHISTFKSKDGMFIRYHSRIFLQLPHKSN